MAPSRPDSLIHDWNAVGPHHFGRPGALLVQDETLRDGLQSPSVTEPSEQSRSELIDLMEQLGIDSASFGIPAAGARQYAAVEHACRRIAERGLSLRPNAGARTVVADVRPIVQIGQTTGVPLEACLFIGSSPIRQYVEDWDLDQLLRMTRDAVAFAVGEGLEVMFITEDTTRSTPQQLRALIGAAVDAGATRICLCDTVGCAMPEGVLNLVAWVREQLDQIDRRVEIDWHGHQDRGLALANSLAAIRAGATRIHATALGLGERVGNASMEQLLVNLKLLGLRDDDLTPLPQYVRTMTRCLSTALPPGTPIVGEDAFRTATGVHASAVLKAREKGDDWLADRIYSGVPAAWVGRRQRISLGPMSGASNVRAVLDELGIPVTEARLKVLLDHAKTAERVLTPGEVREVMRG